MPTFNYNRDIPDTPNNPSVDQPKMKINTNSTDDLIDVDHYSFDTSNKDGFHRKVTFGDNIGAPGFGTGVSDMFANVSNGQSWPFWQNAAGTYQMLGLANSLAQSGYYILPLGLKLQWGFKATPGASGSVNFPVAFTGNPYIIQATLYRDSGRPVSIDSGTPPTNTKFNYVCDSGGADGLYWFAIGAQ